MIKVEHITKKYGKRTILKDISFSANCGEKIAIIGRNGCGKSTLMQIMAGIMKPDSGSLQYFDKNPQKEQKVFRSLCGYVPQGNPLIEELSVKDNLKLFGATSKHIESDFLDNFELQPILNQKVASLSGGMKRRVSFACAVFYLPAILFLDEPTTALDIYYKTTIHNWMNTYQKMNGILVMTTHDEQEILMCDRCFFMSDGTLRELTAEERSLERIRNLILKS